MGSCVSNGKDIIEMRTNNLNNNFKHPYNIKNNKKYKSVQLSSFKINNCPNIKKSKKISSYVFRRYSRNAKYI